MWGKASHVPLSRDNRIPRAPGTCKSHHKVLPPLLCLWLQPELQSLDPAEVWWESCIQEAQAHGNMQSCKGLQGFCSFFSWFSGSQIENHSLNLQWVRGWSVLHKLHITAHSKAAGPAGRWQNWSLGRWIPTNMSCFWVMNYCDPFPPKLASVLYCSHFSSHQSHPSRE